MLLGASLLVSCGQSTQQAQLDGSSRRPNFEDGQIFRIDTVPLDELQRGDLVLVKIDERQWIKRLVGLPNETITIRDGLVFINGTKLDEPYEVIPPTYSMPEIKLESNSFFVLGDNRPNSVDSHQWGGITGDNIEGKATLP
jgi:signal peptidase I